MWFYNGVPYMCEPIDIIFKVRQEAQIRGFNLLKSIKQTTNAIMLTCPWHNGGQESKPSCGLIIKQKHKDAMPVGTVHCFACGHISTLEEFISNCLGYNDGGIYGAKFLSKYFVQIAINDRSIQDLSENLSRNNKLNNLNSLNNNSYISEQELDSYRFIHPYMYERKMDDRVINIFDIGYDPKFKLKPDDRSCIPMECITFPVRDEKGNCLFIARRAIHSKVFHYPDSSIKPIYGLYELNKYAPPDINEIYVCESMINCITVWRYGKYAVALNGTGSSTQIRDLAKLKYRHIILALDPDDAGNKGAQKIFNELHKTKLVTKAIVPIGKDINNLSYEEFINLPQIFMRETN